MNIIYYCKKCGFLRSGDEFIDFKCSDCHTNLLRTEISEYEWNHMTKQQQEAAMKKYTKGQELTSDKSKKASESKSNEVLAKDETEKGDIHQIMEDVHFMKTVLLVQVILFLAVLALLLISLLAGIIAS